LAAEGNEFVARTVLERLQTMAFPNKGLEIGFTDERPEKEQTHTYQYKGGLVDFVKHVSAISRGKAYFTNTMSLGQFVLMDFLRKKTRHVS